MRLLIDALPLPKDERILTSFAGAEDAAVYRLDDDRALVFTTDVITPLVDDPEIFGAIAATNAISDVWAMGGEPLLSLSFIGTPVGFPMDIAADIVRGGGRVAVQAGAPILGGHSIQSKDLLFGLAVVGQVHPEKLFRNDAVQAGDQLILTKPLGTGVLTTAFRSEKLPWDQLHDAVEGMTTTHAAAVPLLRNAEVGAATDITGFGLLGHSAELAQASSVRLIINQGQVPDYAPAREMFRRKVSNRAIRSNLEYAQSLGPLVGEPEPLMTDAQTSGGLLAAVEPGRVDELLKALREAGYARTAHIGEAVGGIGVEVR